MSKKAVYIIVFLIAGLGSILPLWFSINFDANKKYFYDEINTIHKMNAQIITDFNDVTLATLPDFVDEKNKEYLSLTSDIKAKQLQKDIFYTYIVELNDLDENGFAKYKAKFPERSSLLFSQSERKDDFINGFNRVNDYISLHDYILSSESEYSVVKQDYLKQKIYARAFGNLLKRVHDINDVISESRKINDLNILQTDIKSFIREGFVLNLIVILLYTLLVIAIAMTLVFSFIRIATSVKSSYKILLGAVLLVVIFLIAYFVSSSELSQSAITLGHTLNQMKWIEAGIITSYVLFVGTILAILTTLFINKLKRI